MKTSELYQNLFPLEKPLPEIDDKMELEIQEIVKNCDYVIDCDKIIEADKFPESWKVNTSDAVIFYKMGYEAALKRIETVLKPINVKISSESLGYLERIIGDKTVIVVGNSPLLNIPKPYTNLPPEVFELKMADQINKYDSVSNKHDHRRKSSREI